MIRRCCRPQKPQQTPQLRRNSKINYTISISHKMVEPNTSRCGFLFAAARQFEPELPLIWTNVLSDVSELWSGFLLNPYKPVPILQDWKCPSVLQASKDSSAHTPAKSHTLKGSERERETDNSERFMNESSLLLMPEMTQCESGRYAILF